MASCGRCFDTDVADGDRCLDAELAAEGGRSDDDDDCLPTGGSISNDGMRTTIMFAIAFANVEEVFRRSRRNGRND